MNRYKNGLLTILFLIGVSSAALAYMGSHGPGVTPAHLPIDHGSAGDRVSIHTALTQDKVMQGGDGNVSVALTISAENVPLSTDGNMQPVDLVVVLDRSGSMKGQKIRDAKKAVIDLLDDLSAQDRIGIVTYSSGVELLCPLVYVNEASRENISTRVSHIVADGGTNLGGGLKNGIAALMQTTRTDRQRKIILISDGLANHGITSPEKLGAMAANGSEYNLAVSTVGVGYDFNEVLMTTIADHGGGNYYFLKNPRDFAGIFAKEFKTTRTIAAGGVEVKIPLADGLQLTGAGGFPIRIENNVATIRPGNILAGQQRKIFLSYLVPTQQEGTFSLGTIELHYRYDSGSQVATAQESLHVACVADQKEVTASIDESVWAEQVLKEDYSRLKENVAAAIRTGQKDEALQVIEEYEHRNTTINSSVDSDKVRQNIERDVTSLRHNVQSTFSGAPAAVAEKKKQYSKTLQYEGYQVRRDKK